MATVSYTRTDLLSLTLNTYSTGAQQNPDLLALSNGGFVAAYNNGGDSVSVNFYDASGAVVGVAQLAAPASSMTPQGQPSLTQLANGNVVVVWDDAQGTGRIGASIFTSTGTPIATDISVGGGTGTLFGTPTVTALANGNFVVAAEYGGDIYFDIVGPTGTNVLFYTLANTTVTGTQTDAQVTVLSNGGFVVTWTDTNPADQQIRGRIYDASGTPIAGADFLIAATGDNTQSSVAKLVGGGFVVAYTDSGWAEGGTLGNGISLQYVSATGGVGSVIHVNTTSTVDEVEPDVTVLPNGFVLVTWSVPFSASDFDVYGALFDSFGSRVQVNGSDQFVMSSSSDNQLHPVIAGIMNGNYVVGWENTTTTDIDGKLSQIVRLTTGDGTGETLTGDQLSDVINAGGGNDTINGGTGQDSLYGQTGDDTIIIDQAQTATGNVYDGGSGTDTLRLGGTSFSHDLRDDTIVSIENIALSDPGINQSSFVYLNANQFGTGISLTANVTGVSFSDVHETISIAMGAAVALDLSGLNVTNFSSTTDIILITGDGDAETIIGTNVKDEIHAGEGTDYIDGKGGDDLLYGDAGDDTYIVDSAGDKVFEVAGAGYDTVLTSVSYALASGSFVENLATTSIAGASDIVLTGNEFAQTITGNAGNNVIVGGGGADTMIGSLGNDTYIVDDVGDVVTELDSQGSDTVRAAVSYVLAAGVSVESLETDSALGTIAINLTGNELAQNLVGNMGDNVLNGGGGIDTMQGGGGNDTYVVDNPADAIVEVDGQGTDTLLAAVSYVLGAGISIESLATDSAAGTANINLVGNEFSQSLTGNAGANVLNGAGGADVMAGGFGNDSYVVDNAGDVIIESDGQGIDTVMTSVSYVLGAGASVESLTVDSTGGTAAFNLIGNEFSQSILGNKGVNKLSGLGGADTLYGFAGKDVLSGGSGNDILVGGAQADKLLGGSGTDTASYAGATKGVIANLASTAKNTGDAKGDSYSSIENLTGSSKDDTLIGNKLANTLSGSAGNDKLYGGLGKDILFGGGGKDTFVFDTKLGASNVDKIGDFLAKSDTVFLDKDIFTEAGGPGQISASFFHIGKTAEDQDDRIIYDKASGKLWYDADGTGSDAAVQFATMGKGLALTAADFVIIS